MNQFYTYCLLILISSICSHISVTLASDTEQDRPISKKRSRTVFATSHAHAAESDHPAETFSFAQTNQRYGVPTYDALFKYVLDKESLQPSFFHALAGLNVTKATRIDEHMNPLQELESLRTLINHEKTAKAFSSLHTKSGVSVSYQHQKGPKVHKEFTQFITKLLPCFDDLKRAFPKPRYGGTMDFVCQLSNGEYAMVEMQVIPYDYWDRRALAYVAAFYGRQMHKGAKWKDIKRVIGINILGGGKDGLEHWRDTPSEYMRHYKMQEQLHVPSRYIDGIEIIQYSLMHTPEILGDKEKQDWFTFFKEASSMTEEDVLKNITTPAVLEAFERAKLSDLPDRVREMYNMEDEQYKQYSIHTQEQIEKGKAEGIEIGESKTFCTLIQQMRKNNKSDRKIKKRLGLSNEKFDEYVRLIK